MTHSGYAVQPDPGDVLVLRALGLGDTLTGVAALRGVRRAWPGRRLVLAAPAPLGGWLVDLGVVDAVLPTDGLEPDWLPHATTWPGGHLGVNLHGRGPQSHRLLQATRPADLIAFGCPEIGHDGPSWRRDEHEVERWCRLVRAAGGACDPEDLRLRLTVDAGAHPDRTRVVRRTGRALCDAPDAPGASDAMDGPGTMDSPDAPGAVESDVVPHVVLHPGAASGSRRWPPERWAELARRLAAASLSVVVTGSAGESALCAQVVSAAPGARSVAGELDLAGLARLVAAARLLLCGDTGVAHLATALGTPSVLLFGPTPPRWWGPALDPERHTVLWHGESPGDPHADEVDPALAAIGVDEVWEAALAQLDRVAVRRSG